MTDLKVSVIAGKDLAKRFQHAGADARRTIRHEFNAGLYLFAGLWKANISKTFTRRTGVMENVVVEPAIESALGVEGKVTNPAIYARIHEYGGDIHAKNVAHLAIPLKAMQTSRGVARGSARDVISSPSSYGFDSTFTKKGIIFGRSGSTISALFKLQESVRLPERPTARPAMEEFTPIFETKMRSAFVTLFQRAA